MILILVSVYIVQNVWSKVNTKSSLMIIVEKKNKKQSQIIDAGS